MAPGDGAGRRMWVGISPAAVLSHPTLITLPLATIAVNLASEPTVGSLSIGLTQPDVQQRHPMVILQFGLLPRLLLVRR